MRKKYCSKRRNKSLVFDVYLTYDEQKKWFCKTSGFRRFVCAFLRSNFELRFGCSCCTSVCMCVCKCVYVRLSVIFCCVFSFRFCQRTKWKRKQTEIRTWNFSLFEIRKSRLLNAKRQLVAKNPINIDKLIKLHARYISEFRDIRHAEICFKSKCLRCGPW